MRGPRKRSGATRTTMCDRKTGYKNARAAHQAANVYKERRGDPLRVYRCPFCTRWHLTSKEGAAA